MRVLFANLKQFYQCWRLWIAYAVLGSFLYFGISLDQLRPSLLRIMILLTTFGAWIVTELREALSTRPLSFCLPGQRERLREFVFVSGLILSVIGGLYSALNYRLPDASPYVLISVVFVTLCFAWFIYLVAVGLALVAGSQTLMCVCFPILSLANSFEDSHPASGYVILAHPIQVSLLAIFATVLVWRWLDRPNWFRKRCGKPSVDFLFASMSSLKRETRQQRHVSSRSPEFFFAWDKWLLMVLRRMRPLSTLRCVANVVYTTLVQLLTAITYWKSGFFFGGLLLMLVLAAGWMPGMGIFFIAPLTGGLAIGVGMMTPLSSQMMIHGGRRERSYATATFIAVAAGLMTVVLIPFILVMNLLTPWLPSMTIYGVTLAYHPIALRTPMISLIVFPIVSLLTVWFGGRRGGLAIPGIILWGILMLPIFRLWHFPTPSLLTWTIAGILSWFVFVVCVHRIAMRSDLVRR